MTPPGGPRAPLSLPPPERTVRLSSLAWVFPRRIWAAIRGPSADARSGRRAAAGHPPSSSSSGPSAARRAGQMAEAEALVTQARIDPRNGLALLLSGYLHAAPGAPDAAAHRVPDRARDGPRPPRAMLGLAKTTSRRASRGLRARAARAGAPVYPDFPEARALLDVVGAVLTGRGESTPGPLTALQFRQLASRRARESAWWWASTAPCSFSHPVSRTRQALADHLASRGRRHGRRAALGRAGLGRCGAARSAPLGHDLPREPDSRASPGAHAAPRRRAGGRAPRRPRRSGRAAWTSSPPAEAGPRGEPSGESVPSRAEQVRSDPRRRRADGPGAGRRPRGPRRLRDRRAAPPATSRSSRSRRWPPRSAASSSSAPTA